MKGSEFTVGEMQEEQVSKQETGRFYCEDGRGPSHHNLIAVGSGFKPSIVPVLGVASGPGAAAGSSHLHTTPERIFPSAFKFVL